MDPKRAPRPLSSLSIDIARFASCHGFTPAHRLPNGMSNVTAHGRRRRTRCRNHGCPGVRSGRSGTARGLPVSRVHAALPPTWLGRTRHDGDLGSGCRDHDRVDRVARPSRWRRSGSPTSARRSSCGTGEAASRCIARWCGRTDGRPSGARRSRRKDSLPLVRDTNRPRARSVLLGVEARVVADRRRRRCRPDNWRSAPSTRGWSGS